MKEKMEIENDPDFNILIEGDIIRADGEPEE